MKTLKLTLSVILISIVVASCSKDQEVVKQLASGTWEVTAMSYNGISLPDSTFAGDKYTFEKCKVSKGDCSGEYTTTDPTKGDVVTSFTYSISDKGETISITMSLFGIPASSTGDILEHSKDKFVWSSKDVNGDVTETTIETI
jgi:hypothetical protein